MTLVAGVDPRVEPGFADVATDALRGDPCHLVGAHRTVPLPVGRWTGRADPCDVALLAHCVGPTLDVGCGPGRMGEHLRERGLGVLGIDVVPEAVAQTRRRGVPALRLDALRDGVPGSGHWSTVLLADGNIGIGGDPVSLLRRCWSWLAPGGRVVLDLAADGSGLHRATVRLACAGRRSEAFAWAWLDAAALVGTVAAAGFAVGHLSSDGDRPAAVLHRLEEPDARAAGGGGVVP